MRKALIGSGWKTHYVTNYSLGRSNPKTLCGKRVYADFDDDGELATGTNGFCQRCLSAKTSCEGIKAIKSKRDK